MSYRSLRNKTALKGSQCLMQIQGKKRVNVVYKFDK